MEDYEQRLQELKQRLTLQEKDNEGLQEGDIIRGTVLIGEASNSIQLLLEYIISVKTQTESVFGKSIYKLEKDLDLKGACNRQYKSLTKSYEKKSEDYEQGNKTKEDLETRLEYLKTLQGELGIDPDTEKYITDTVQTRNGEVHVKWNDANYRLLQYYIDHKKLVEPDIFIPNVVQILKKLYDKAREICTPLQKAQRKGAQRQEAQRQEAQRQEAQRQDAQRQEAQRQDAQRQEAQRQEAQRGSLPRQSPMQTGIVGTSAADAGTSEAGADAAESWTPVRGKPRTRRAGGPYKRGFPK